MSSSHLEINVAYDSFKSHCGISLLGILSNIRSTLTLNSWMDFCDNFDSKVEIASIWVN